MNLIISASLLLAAVFAFDSYLATWIMAAGQFVILGGFFAERRITACGSFIFMSVLFFAVRPIYLILEKDFLLFDNLFVINPSTHDLNVAMWWASMGILLFQVGRKYSKSLHLTTWNRRRLKTKANKSQSITINSKAVVILIVAQTVSVLLMAVLGRAGKGLSDSSFGAYLYDLPQVFQGIHIFALVANFAKVKERKSGSAIILFSISSFLFLLLVYEMRNVAVSRGFYLTGTLTAGIAILSQCRNRINLAWLAIPVILFFPTFRFLGETRLLDNAQLKESMPDDSQKKSILNSYWSFYDSKGDMNIFDTYVAANLSQPKYHPLALSWIYVPAHLIPRSLWPSKPLKGTLQDVSFTNGAPYSPGLAGYFLLDGGPFWMLLCMLFLGYLLGVVDLMILTMERNLLYFCLYAILVVNAMGFSRYFLWQFFYSVLYTAVPCILFYNFFRNRRDGKCEIVKRHYKIHSGQNRNFRSMQHRLKNEAQSGSRSSKSENLAKSSAVRP